MAALFVAIFHSFGLQYSATTIWCERKAANQKLLVHSDTCGRNVNESQRPVARARACARATLT